MNRAFSNRFGENYEFSTLLELRTGIQSKAFCRAYADQGEYGQTVNAELITDGRVELDQVPSILKIEKSFVRNKHKHEIILEKCIPTLIHQIDDSSRLFIKLLPSSIKNRITSDCSDLDIPKQYLRSEIFSPGIFLGWKQNTGFPEPDWKDESLLLHISSVERSRGDAVFPKRKQSEEYLTMQISTQSYSEETWDRMFDLQEAFLALLGFANRKRISPLLNRKVWISSPSLISEVEYFHRSRPVSIYPIPLVDTLSAKDFCIKGLKFAADSHQLRECLTLHNLAMTNPSLENGLLLMFSALDNLVTWLDKENEHPSLHVDISCKELLKKIKELDIPDSGFDRLSSIINNLWNAPAFRKKIEWIINHYDIVWKDILVEKKGRPDLGKLIEVRNTLAHGELSRLEGKNVVDLHRKLQLLVERCVLRVLKMKPDKKMFDCDRAFSAN